MSDFYIDADKDFVEYRSGALPGVKGRWRDAGALPSLGAGNYATAIGAGQTFGRFVARPFPTILGQTLDMPIVNLGIGGAGPSNFRQHELLSFINGGRFCIVQAMSGRSTINDYFDPWSGRNAFGLQKGEKGPANFAETVVRHVIAQNDPVLLRSMVHAMRRSWIMQYYWLFRAIKPPKILFWFSERDMSYEQGGSDLDTVAGGFPQFIDLPTFQAIKPQAQHVVELVSSRGRPHRLVKDGQPVQLDMGNGRHVTENRYYPSPGMHEDAAVALEEACRTALADPEAPPVTTLFARKPVHRAPPAEADIQPNFLVIGAAKSGTSAFVTQLSAHPEIYFPAAKELHFFNSAPSVQNRDDDSAWRRYLSHFDGAAGFKRRGEATVAYTMMPIVKNVPERIKARLGVIPLIYLVREPIERIVSQYRHAKRTDPGILGLDEWLLDPHNWNATVLRSNYRKQLAPFVEQFGADNLLVLFYEDFKRDRLETLHRACTFLDVGAEGADMATDAVVNRTNERDVPVPRLAGPTMRRIVDALRDDTLSFLRDYGKPEGFWPAFAGPSE